MFAGSKTVPRASVMARAPGGRAAPEYRSPTARPQLLSAAFIPLDAGFHWKIEQDPSVPEERWLGF